MMTPSRRELLRGGTAAALLAATGGCEWFNKIGAQRPVRKDITTLAPNGIELNTLRDGIKLMRNLPPSDLRHWDKMAEIHAA